MEIVALNVGAIYSIRARYTVPFVDIYRPSAFGILAILLDYSLLFSFLNLGFGENIYLTIN